MKTYRIQVRYAKLYFDFTTKAATEDDAGMALVKAINEGAIQGEYEPLYTPKICFIFIEEVSDDTTQRVIRQETRA